MDALEAELERERAKVGCKLAVDTSAQPVSLQTSAGEARSPGARGGCTNAAQDWKLEEMERLKAQVLTRGCSTSLPAASAWGICAGW